MTEHHDTETAIRQMLQAYQGAVDAKDVDAFMTLFDDDVRVFDMWGRWSYEGADAWRAMASGWFGSLGSERVAVVFDDVRIDAADGLAAAHAFVTFTALSAEGVKLRSLQNRMTWLLRRRPGGAWKVVHEHTSAPIAGDTTKAILQR